MHLVRVFISSTVEDLRPYREAARDAVFVAEMLPQMMEYFVGASEKPPLASCLAKVSEADLLVVIVAHRYGWVPSDQPDSGHKSITWLECERAAAEGKEVFAFLVDERHPWPEDQREEHGVVRAIREGSATPDLLADVQRNVDHLRQFKAWLQTRGIRTLFTTPEDLRHRVSEALRDWSRRNPNLLPRASGKRSPPPSEPTRYLRDLLWMSSFIDIRGLQVGSGQAHRFPIQGLFISLTTTLPGTRQSGAGHHRRRRPLANEESQRGNRESIAVPLHSALKNDRLVVVGDPGSGKTTFLRHVAHALCETQLGDQADAARVRIGIEDRTFPIFLRLNELAQHIQRHTGRATAPSKDDAPTWLPHYLATASADNSWGLQTDFFRELLEGGQCTMLLDGLDEVPDRVFREGMSDLIENLTNTYEHCRFVITSRPAAYAGETILPEFEQANIDPLSDEAMEVFASRWCEALYAESEEVVQAHRDELLEALRRQRDISHMARNPMMLTALAVLHWNEYRLPEQRAEVYESIIRWLSRSREMRPGRATAERTVVLLQELALAMQGDAADCSTHVSRRWAAERIASEVGDGQVSTDAIQAAERFLDEEEVDSGIIIARGQELQFWHRAFQQYLAARALAARVDDEWERVILQRRNLLYDASWTEVVLLLAHILHGQRPSRVDRLISAILSRVGDKSALDERQKCAELVGSIEADLAPLGYEGHDARYDRLRQDMQAELVRQIARSTCRTSELSHIGEMVAKLPEGETGFLKETPRIRQMVQEIAKIQNRLDTISQSILREPYARLLVTEIENFQYRIVGFGEPLAEEFTKASEAWLRVARSQLSIAENIAVTDSLPQVFRAGDPVDRDREAFVIRYAVMGEIERQVMLSSGCPGIVLYARRRMGKSTALRNLPAFLPKTVRTAAISMQRPQAFASLASFMQEVAEAVDAAVSPRQTADEIPADLVGFYRLLQQWDKSLQERDERLIIAFDEYENIDEKLGAGVFPLDLLATVRESIQSHRHLTWLFSGSHEITELRHAEWTSYLVSARTIEIPPFSEAETRALLTDPMRHSSLWPDESKRPRFPVEVWGPNGIERIHAEAGGWPHLVQLIAETAVDLLNERTETRLTETLLEQALDKAIVSGHNVLHQLLRKESRLPGEWEYLAAFKTSDSQSPPTDESLARSLQRRLLVEQTLDGQWRLRVPLLQRWLRTRA